MSYREKIQELLLNAGVHGMEQKTLTIKLRNEVKGEDIRKELENLFNRDLIQKFIKPSAMGKGGPPTTIWRATTNLAHHYYPKES